MTQMTGDRAIREAGGTPPPEPYTEYEIFCRLERTRIIQALGIVDAEVIFSLDPNHDDPLEFPRPKKYRSIIMPPYWYSRSRNAVEIEEKRSRRRSEGREDSRTLRKAVSAGWRNANEEVIGYCRKLAQSELEKYNDLIAMPCANASTKDTGEARFALHEGWVEKIPTSIQKAQVEEQDQQLERVKEEGQLQGKGQKHGQIDVPTPAVTKAKAAPKSVQRKPTPDCTLVVEEEEVSAAAPTKPSFNSDDFNVVVGQGEAILKILWNTNLTGWLPQIVEEYSTTSSLSSLTRPSDSIGGFSMPPLPGRSPSLRQEKKHKLSRRASAPPEAIDLSNSDHDISSSADERPTSALSPLTRPSDSIGGFSMPPLPGRSPSLRPEKKHKLSRRASAPPEVIDLSNSDHDISSSADERAVKHDTPRRVSNESLPTMAGQDLHELKRMRVAPLAPPTPIPALIQYEHDKSCCNLNWDREDADAILDILNGQEGGDGESPPPIAKGSVLGEPGAGDRDGLPLDIQCDVLNIDEHEGDGDGPTQVSKWGLVNDPEAAGAPPPDSEGSFPHMPPNSQCVMGMTFYDVEMADMCGLCAEGPDL